MLKVKTNIAEVRRKIRQYEKKVYKEVEKMKSDTAKDIASKAKANCSMVSISGTIRVDTEGTKRIISAGVGLQDPDIAAYMEFGTGNFAKARVAGLPEDWSEYAMTFYKNGLGMLPANPYLYPAYWSVLYQLEKTGEKRLNSV